MDSPQQVAEQMQDPAFWRRIVPTMNTSGMVLGTAFEPDPRILDLCYQELCAIGYTQLDGLLPLDELAEILAAVKAVRSTGLLPMYVFAFDEPWGIYLRLSPVWRRMLGLDWQFLPAVWTWWIEQGPGNAGWPAHRDRGKQIAIREDGSPLSLSAWVPLTRSLPSNGCMYVLPKGLEFEMLTMQNIQHARALPAAPGTVLLWNQNVWHWSGQSSRRAPNPRVSMAFELQTASVPPFQTPLLDPLACPPPLNVRLGLVAQQILQYRHFTRLEGPQIELAEALLKYL
jgi:hypothetical protein